MTKSNVLAILKSVNAQPGGGAVSGTFDAQQFRLDEVWIIECHFDHGFLGYKLFSGILEVWVEPSSNFTGLWTTYYVNGQKSCEAYFKNGKGNGQVTYFYADGSKAYMTHFIDGIEDGDEIGYFPSGKISYRGTYKTNEMVGTWTWFNEDGTIQSTQQRPIH